MCKLSDCGPESRYCHLNFRLPALSKKFLDIKANYRVWIHSETRTRHDNKIHLILNWVMKLNLCVFFFFFVFETPLKDFQCFSPILLALWLRYLQTRVKESCMHLPSQRFFKTSHKTPHEIPRKVQEKCVFQQSTGISFKNIHFSFYHGSPHGATEQSN